MSKPKYANERSEIKRRVGLYKNVVLYMMKRLTGIYKMTSIDDKDKEESIEAVGTTTRRLFGWNNVGMDRRTNGCRGE